MAKPTKTTLVIWVRSLGFLVCSSRVQDILIPSFTFHFDHATGNALGGSHEANKNAPLACFNALKSWYTGWYEGGHLNVTQEGWDGPLVGIDDYNNGRLLDGDRVILRIPHPTDVLEDLYLMYNRAKGVNVGVSDGIDKVVIVKGFINATTYMPSSQVAQLDATEDGSIFMSADHGIDGSRLIVKVHSTSRLVGERDFADVEVMYDFTPTSAPTSCTEGDFHFELKTDNFPGETSWEVREQGTEILMASGSDYGRQHWDYEHVSCFESNGPFEFIIKDKYGDGICCSQGTGSYRIFFNGDLVVENGQYGKGETIILFDISDTDQLQSDTPGPTASPVTRGPTTEPTSSPTLMATIQRAMLHYCSVQNNITRTSINT
jgi:hypothetical protein